MSRFKHLIAAATLAAFSSPALADAISGHVEQQETNWTAIAHVRALRPVHARHHLLGGQAHPFRRAVLYGRRRHHRLPERPRHRRRLYVGGVLPRHFRPRLPVGLRRPDLFGGLARRLADRHLPDRGAAAQSRQVHLRRRRLVPLPADADPHPGRLRHAGHRRLLSDRPDGRRRRADPAAVRPALLCTP